MLRDSNQRSRSRRAHSSFFANRKPPPLIPSLVVGAVFLLALLFLTVPNWGEFSRSVSQFPALWQISSNRREIIFLVIRVCSPLLLAAIAGACCWLWYTIRAYLRKEEPPEQVQPRGPMLPSSPVGQRKASTSSTQEPGQRGAPSLPSTPIPPVLSNPRKTRRARSLPGKRQRERKSTTTWQNVPRKSRPTTGRAQAIVSLQRPLPKTPIYQWKR